MSIPSAPTLRSVRAEIDFTSQQSVEAATKTAWERAIALFDCDIDRLTVYLTEVSIDHEGRHRFSFVAVGPTYLERPLARIAPEDSLASEDLS